MPRAQGREAAPLQMALGRAARVLAAALGMRVSGASAAGGAGDTVSLLQTSPQLSRGDLSRGGHVYYMHIPRTAGTSFSVDAAKLLFEGFNLFDPLSVESREGCYGWREHMGASWVATMLRNPRNHVLSQYLLCGEGTIALMTSVQKGPGGFGLWVKEWADIYRRQGNIVGDFTNLEGQGKTRDDQYLLFSGMPHKCYNPINLQSHHFTCRHPFMYDNATHGGIELAMQNMQKTRFVGIQEVYQESVCLFASKVISGGLPHFCNCTDEEAWHSFKPGHFSSHSRKTTPRSNFRNVTRHGEEVLRAIDEITAWDRALYRAAVDRFVGEVRLVEAQHGIRLLCGDREKQLHDLANLGPPA